jgi:large subunit ribosomal protein L22
MGKRKRLVADARKEANKSSYFAKLNDCPTSPRKMRIVADLIRGHEVFNALNTLKFSTKHASIKLEKLIKSAIANYEAVQPVFSPPIFPSRGPYEPLRFWD